MADRALWFCLSLFLIGCGGETEDTLVIDAAVLADAVALPDAAVLLDVAMRIDANSIRDAAVFDLGQDSTIAPIDSGVIADVALADEGVASGWSPAIDIAEGQASGLSGHPVSLRAVEDDLWLAWGLSPQVARRSTGWAPASFQGWQLWQVGQLDLVDSEPIRMLGVSAGQMVFAQAGPEPLELSRVEFPGSKPRSIRMTQDSRGVAHFVFADGAPNDEVYHVSWDGIAWSDRSLTGVRGVVDALTTQDDGALVMIVRQDEFGAGGLSTYVLHEQWGMSYSTATDLGYDEAVFVEGSGGAGFIFVDQDDQAWLVENGIEHLVAMNVQEVRAAKSGDTVHVLYEPRSERPSESMLMHVQVRMGEALMVQPIPGTTDPGHFAIVADGTGLAAVWIDSQLIVKFTQFQSSP